MTLDRNSSSSMCERSRRSFPFLVLSPDGVWEFLEYPACSSSSSWAVARIPSSLSGLSDGGSKVISSLDGSDNSLRSCPRAGRVLMFNICPHCSAILRSGVMIATGCLTAYPMTAASGSRRGNLEKLEGGNKKKAHQP